MSGPSTYETLLRLALLVFICSHWSALVEAKIDLTRVTCHPKSGLLGMLSSRCICEPCELCFFLFTSWECRSIENQDSTTVVVPYADDLLGLQQPQLEASDWFLTESELTKSRNGVPRRRMQVFSEGNTVQLFTATNKFFSSVYNDMESLNDSAWQVFVAGWSVDNVPFRPRKSNWQNTTFQELFGRIIERDIKVRALIWANMLERAQNVKIQAWMNGFRSKQQNERSSERAGLMLFDNRLPYHTSSHHQKSLVLSHPNHSTIAYIGGIDMTNDRWDTRFHNHTKLRKMRKIARRYDGWVDSSVRIEGPASQDVAANFVARWNAKESPLQPDKEIVEFDNPVVSTEGMHITIDEQESPSNPLYGTTSIQIVRTFSCKVGYEFAPRGEISLLDSRIKAIGRARNYIYIEDQYFINVPVLQTALLQQLALIEALVVVTQKPTLGTSAVGYGKLLYENMKPLTTQFPEKVHLFTMKPALDLYIHTKAVVIDDVFLSIGSANWNQRSMTSDSEIAANMVDRKAVAETPDGVQVNSLAREFRLRKFSELTGLAIDELRDMTFFDGVHALEQAAITATSVISKLDVEYELYFDMFPNELQDVIDPFDECNTQ
uniref:phospholipase D n=1 Tax=Globisporangium ultimum (strain ATCC 200006 / CBS 805.95 / DAOM BR144) TaxID=431595 RepID=K3WNR5_GLOUD